MIILFVIVGLIYDLGGIKGHPGPVGPFTFLAFIAFSTLSSMEGLSNFKNGQAFIGGFSTFVANIVYALYAFGGVELVSIAAGESSKPYKSVPRATKATFIRLVVFYILMMLTIGLCINHGDETLLDASRKYL